MNDDKYALPVASPIPGVFRVLSWGDGTYSIDFGGGFELIGKDDVRNPFRGLSPDALSEFRG